MKIIDALSYAGRVFVKSGPPFQLTYFVTSRCNLKCKHCFYWKSLDSNHSNELSIDEIQKIADSIPRLLVLSLTGGEPFIREDITDICEAFIRSTRPHIVTVSTNGSYRERIERFVTTVMKKHRNTNLFIYVSIDGPEEINDQIRGKNTYAQAIETLKMLKPLRKTYKRFGVAITLTCNNLNQDYLADTLCEFGKSNLVDNISIGMIRGNPKDPAIKQIDLEKYQRLTNLKIRLYENHGLKYFKFMLNKIAASKDYYTYKIVNEIVDCDHYILPCYAGSLMGILYDSGDIYPCEILDDNDAFLGNIRDYSYDLPELWAANKAKEIRNRIINDRCYCTFECAMSSNILFNPRYLAKCIRRAVSPNEKKSV